MVSLVQHDLAVFLKCFSSAGYTVVNVLLDTVNTMFTNA